jgi:hypothetical protein
MVPIRIVLIFLGLAHSTVLGQIRTTPSMSTLSVCDVLRGLKSLDGQVVTVRGVFSFNRRHGGNLSEPGLDGFMPCPNMPRKARIWWSAIQLESPNPSLEGGPPTFKEESPTYADLIEMWDGPKRKEVRRLIVTFVGEIRTKRDLLIVRAPYGRGNTMGNGYGEGGALPAMLVIKTFRDVQAEAVNPSTVLIVGRVIDATGDGVSKTAVTLWTGGTNQKVAETKTDGHGEFTLPEAPAQAYELHFYSQHYGPQTRRISEADHGDLYIGDVKLPALNTLATPVKTNLCELLAKPSLFHGKFVETHADLRSLGADATTAFTDANCGAEMRLSMPDETRRLTEVRKLRQYLSRGQVAEATIMGKFEMQLVLGGIPEFKFHLLSASNVTAESIRR